MATFQFYTIAPEAFPYDSGSNSFTLDPGYDPTQDRILLTITDDDQFLDGDFGVDEVGDDTNQTATATTPDGTPITSGQIYAESYARIQAPDGTIIYIDRIEIGGQNVGYSPSQPLDPGVTYTFLDETNIDDAPGGDPAADNRMTYSQYQAQSVACFVSGTLLLTRDGMMPVDWITVGDDLWTQDHGWQPVRWRGLTQFGTTPDFQHPIEIQPGALGPDTPSEVLRVSPQHRLLLSGTLCELWFAEPEVLVAAKHLLHWPDITRATLDPDYAYHHFLLDQHDVLTTGNLGTESLFLGSQIAEMAMAPPWPVVRDFVDGHRKTARLCLTARQARVLPPGRFPAALVLPQEGGGEAVQADRYAAFTG